MCVCMCVYVCMLVCVGVYVCVCVCVYACDFYLFIKHAPLLQNNTKCYKFTFNFSCSGCSDQHHGVSHCVPFTFLNNTPI
jgi:hypothetical protein